MGNDRPNIAAMVTHGYNEMMADLEERDRRTYDELRRRLAQGTLTTQAYDTWQRLVSYWFGADMGAFDGPGMYPAHLASMRDALRNAKYELDSRAWETGINDINDAMRYWRWHIADINRT